MLTKNSLLVASCFLCVIAPVDTTADCTMSSIGICLPNVPDPLKISDTAKQAAGHVEQLGNSTLTTVSSAPNEIARTLQNAGGDTINMVEKAGGDIVHTTFKTADNFISSYTKAWKDVSEQAKRSFQDAVDAGKATLNFLKNQAESLEQARINANRRFQEGKYIDGMWHLGTDQMQASEENFGKAAQESSVINAAAQTAASVYGGPAGAAAYTAWATYRATGDADLALRAGLISAVTTQTGGSVAKMPSGTLGEVLKKSAMAGAAGGIAVAAAGGDEQAVKDAFLKSSGAVLIQAGSDKFSGEIKAYSSQAKDALETVQCISAKDIDCFSRTTYGRDLKDKAKLFVDKKTGELGINTEKLDPQQYVSMWKPLDPNSIEGKKAEIISKISKLPKMEAIPLMKNKWILTWALRPGTSLEHSKPAVVLTYVGDDVPFVSEVRYGTSMTYISSYSCPVPAIGFVRTLTTTKTEEGCDSIYRREGGISQVIWHSEHHPDSCDPKAQEHVAKLSGFGIECSPVLKERPTPIKSKGRVTVRVAPVPVEVMEDNPSEEDSELDSNRDTSSRPRQVVPIPVEPCGARCQ